MENEKSGGTGKSESRSRRLAAELRENLRRRKVQERGRKVPAAGDDTKRMSSQRRDR
jgi:hypothetical protein